jgi:TRAP-type C4-dicarboxylate transport system substrate-binding protein
MKSSKLARKRLIGYIVGIFFLTSCFISQPLFGATKLRMQSAFSASTGIFKEMKDLAKTVEQETNGQIKITVYPPGALAKPLEIFDSVKRGMIDMGQSTGLYHARKLPEGLIEFGMPFSFAGPMYSDVAGKQYHEFFNTWRGGKVKKILNKLYAKQNIHLVGVLTSSSYGIMTKFPVKRLSDFKGKKLRTFGLFSVLAKKIGSAPVSIPAAEQYLALQRGTVQGTIYPFYALESVKLKEVVSHIVYPPPAPIAGLDLYFNMKKWKSLSANHRDVIQKAFDKHKMIYLAKTLAQEKAAIEGAQKVGVKVVTLPPEDVEKMKKLGRSTWAISAKKSKTSAELIQLMTEYLKEKGVY